MAARAGGTLIEVLIALVILSTATASVTSHVAAVTFDQTILDDRERELMRAERLLVATSLLGHGELSDRLGVRDVASFKVHVSRPEADLFRISIARGPGDGSDLLATVVLRPAPETNP